MIYVLERSNSLDLLSTCCFYVHVEIYCSTLKFNFFPLLTIFLKYGLLVTGGVRFGGVKRWFALIGERLLLNIGPEFSGDLNSWLNRVILGGEFGGVSGAELSA